jgi:hypothetical protein
MSVISIIRSMTAIKKIKTQLSVGKVMASVFWDSECVIRRCFAPRGVRVHEIIEAGCFRVMCVMQFGKKRPRKVSEESPTA